MFDARNHVRERRIARLQIDVRHPVDWRSVPVVGARVRNPGQSGTGLRDRAAERALKNALADQIGLFRRHPLVVEGVAGKLLRTGRIEADIEQIGAVPVGAEHVEGHETRAGKVAFVAENPV